MKPKGHKSVDPPAIEGDLEAIESLVMSMSDLADEMYDFYNEKRIGFETGIIRGILLGGGVGIVGMILTYFLT